MSSAAAPSPPSDGQPHTARAMAESFGVDARRYDQARPGYPDALVERILSGRSEPELLDVGCGTGIAARQFQAAGARVRGVEPDPRMADYARSRGLDVDVATFENWQPNGRTFDLVTTAQSWHWVDWRAVPESPFNGQPARRPLELYEAMYDRFADAISDTGRFDGPERWRFAWEHQYTRGQWLALLPTTGGLTQVAPVATAEIPHAVGRTIEAAGGAFTMHYRTLATSAVRASS